MRSVFLLPLLLGACVSSTGPSAPRHQPVTTRLAEKRTDPPVSSPEPAAQPVVDKPKEPEPETWTWPMALNLGVRVDTGGAGWFLANRGNRRHHGLDLLAPVGTEVVAACTGRFRTGTREPFGRWVQTVCPLPDRLTGEYPAFVSILYAHLDGWSRESVEFVDVRAGQPVGQVGRTGNAGDKRIRPHLHMETAVHPTVEQAEADEHQTGRKRPAENTGDVEAAILLEDRLKTLGSFRPADKALRRGSLLDPFVLLTCLTTPPEASVPEPPLAEAAKAFTDRYQPKEPN